MIEVAKQRYYGVNIIGLTKVYNTEDYVFSKVTETVEEQEYSWREDSHYNVTKTYEYIVVNWTGKGKTPEQCVEDVKEANKLQLNNFIKRQQNEI